MQVTAVLKEAEIIQRDGWRFARGRCYGDTRGRFNDGDWIRTSDVVKIDGNTVTTRNSIYECEFAKKETAHV